MHRHKWARPSIPNHVCWGATLLIDTSQQVKGLRRPGVYLLHIISGNISNFHREYGSVPRQASHRAPTSIGGNDGIRRDAGSRGEAPWWEGGGREVANYPFITRDRAPVPGGLAWPCLRRGGSARHINSLFPLRSECVLLCEELLQKLTLRSSSLRQDSKNSLDASEVISAHVMEKSEPAVQMWCIINPPIINKSSFMKHLYNSSYAPQRALKATEKWAIWVIQ